MPTAQMHERQRVALDHLQQVQLTFSQQCVMAFYYMYGPIIVSV